MTRSRFLRRALPALALALSSCMTPASKWTDLALPQPTVSQPNTPSDSHSATAVGCAPSGFCLVGISSVIQGDMVESFITAWQADRWGPAKGLSPSSTSLSCASETSCALGSWEGVATWNGTKWTRAADSQLWPAASMSGPTTVSCGAPDHCAAVNNGNAAVWNGTAWTPFPNAVPGAGRVSCAGPDFCLATLAGVGMGRLYKWDGTAWSSVSGVSDPGDGLAVNGLTCWAVSHCDIAISRPRLTPTGVLTDQFVEHWDGTPLPRSDTAPPDVTDLACAGEARCVALRKDQPPLVLDAKGWHEEVLPQPRGASRKPTVVGLSCTPTWCMGVGTWGGGRAVAYRWTF